MKVIYVYRKNDYAALMAAYLLLDIDITNEKTIFVSKGLHFIGTDKNIREIYLLKFSRNKNTLFNIINGLEKIYKEEILVIDLSLFDSLFYVIAKGITKKKIIEKVRRLK